MKCEGARRYLFRACFLITTCLRAATPSLLSTLLGTILPGPGTIYLNQTLDFHHLVEVGDKVTVTITGRAKEMERCYITLDCYCTNQRSYSGIDTVEQKQKETREIITKVPSVIYSSQPNAWRSGNHPEEDEMRGTG